jgi:hypothetical protein
MRQALAVLVPALAALAAAAPLAAQGGGDLARVAYWTVDDVAGFEAGLAAHNAFHAAQQDPTPLFTWQVVSGPRAGQYVRASFNHTWADFDAEEKMAAADAADSATHLDPYLAADLPGIYRYRRELSRPPEGGPQKLARILAFELKFGKSRQFEEAVAKVHAALAEVETWGNYLWYERIDGGQVPAWVLSQPSDTWAGFAPHDPGLAALVAKKYGDQAAAILGAIEEAVERQEVYTLAFRGDLSYVPGGEPE